MWTPWPPAICVLVVLSNSTSIFILHVFQNPQEVTVIVSYNTFSTNIYIFSVNVHVFHWSSFFLTILCFSLGSFYFCPNKSLPYRFKWSLATHFLTFYSSKNVLLYRRRILFIFFGWVLTSNLAVFSCRTLKIFFFHVH